MIFHWKIAAAAALCMSASLFHAAGAIYYVDSDAGNDALDGSTPAHAWKSLKPVNTRVFQPGDQLLLKAGTHYNGQLKPQGSGAPADGHPLREGAGGHFEKQRGVHRA